MKIKRIFALIERDVRINLKNKARLLETFYFPVVSVVIWSFFVSYMKTQMFESALLLLTINIFWSFGSSIQEVINLQMMEDRWSESIGQILRTTIRPSEYLASKIIYSIIIGIIGFCIVTVMVYFVFGFVEIFQNISLFVFLSSITILASAGISLIVGGLILMLGNEYGFLSWTSFPLFILFSGPFFPISIYPKAIQYISRIIPFSWIFESIRQMSSQGYANMSILVIAGILSLFYFLISFPIWFYCFNRARKTGRLVKIW